jgi:hypothetical protein
MKRLTTDGGIKLDCELTSYFRALDTCDELEWELLSQHQQLNGNSEMHFKEFDKRLPLRRSLHAEVPDPVRDGSRRGAAIGVSVLVAFREVEGVTMWLRRKSMKNVATHRGMIHVLPSFMFQPASADLDSEFSVTHNVFREYLEELFGRPDPKDGEGDWQYFYRDPVLVDFRKLIKDEKATFHFTGVVVNLLNLRPEICLLLFISDSEWYGRHRSNTDPDYRFNFNDEFMRSIEAGAHPEQLVARLNYVRSDNDVIPQYISHSDFVPPGAGAFWLGKKCLDDLL